MMDKTRGEGEQRHGTGGGTGRIMISWRKSGQRHGTQSNANAGKSLGAHARLGCHPAPVRQKRARLRQSAVAILPLIVWIEVRPAVRIEVGQEDVYEKIVFGKRNIFSYFS